MGMEGDILWHAPILQNSRRIPYDFIIFFLLRVPIINVEQSNYACSGRRWRGREPGGDFLTLCQLAPRLDLWKLPAAPANACVRREPIACGSTSGAPGSW